MNKTALPSTCTDEKRLVPAPSAAAAESRRRSKVVWTEQRGARGGFEENVMVTAAHSWITASGVRPRLQAS